MTDEKADNLESGHSLGHYRIVKKIGAGGMGEVYLAEDARLERRVALKILPATFAQDAERMRRFVQEAKTVSALNHPNILTIYETGEVENTNYIASEYVEGETLSERLLGKPLSLKETLEAAVQIASALQAAHGAGIVHRDVKPDNVMIRPDGLAKLLDFGIAKLTEKKTESIDAEAATAIKAHTQTGTLIGTAAYMSPEQARGKTVTRGRIFLVSAWCCMKCSPAKRRLRAKTRWTLSARFCTKNLCRSVNYCRICRAKSSASSVKR